MRNSKGKLLPGWLHKRRYCLLLVAGIFAIFFIVYAIYGYGWGVAGYAALLCLVLGAALAIWDFVRFCARHIALTQTMGRFPLEKLPQPDDLIEQDYSDIILALEQARKQLENEKEHTRRDAEEYYTLWAHQIKTPMAAMRLLLQSAGNTLNDGVKADLEQELFRIGQYVDMVLQYQRLSSLQNDLVLERFPLDALVKKAAKNCATLFIYKDLALEMGEIGGSIVTDEKWFCFVLEQIYTNAVKYTAKGAVRVYSQGKDTLVIEDSGMGIPAEDLPRVFERGFTGTVGRRERSSTGIGLYLCRSILERLGFSITLSSKPGVGTKVMLHLAQEVQESE